MKTYRIKNQELYGQKYQVIIGTDGSGKDYYIPKVSENSDYQLYLEWAKTNTAEEIN